jgi:7-cyano-7-deazaguanine synthase
VKKAILLLSGGLDSSTCGLIARDMGFEIYALSFSYGQRHTCELLAARKVASFLGVREHRIVDIDLSALGGSALTSSDIDIPKDGANTGVPATYVPARNLIFLSYALAWAEVQGDCQDIFIGVNHIDYSGYPDCRPEFIAAFQKTANLATVAGTNGCELTIHAPLMQYSKADIIKIGAKAGLDYGLTLSCYDPAPSGVACGCCDSCRIRKKGFEEAQIPDPTEYSAVNTIKS